MPDEPPISGDEERDDGAIGSELRIIRAISPDAVVLIDGEPYPQSDRFSNDSDGSGTSFDLWEGERQPQDLLDGRPGHGVVSLTVGQVRQLELGVVRNQLPDNDHHVLLQGKKTGSKKKQLRKLARWEIMPDGWPRTE